MRAGWARFIKPAIRASIASSPSKFCRRILQIVPNCASDSSAKHKTIASLNHPHICTLYDIGHQDGIDYLVMEYLEGETLAQRLLKGPLPMEQVLQYAIEIADALDKAHRKGITHRDLKPGNIMLTKSGTKLLDFGLAKLKQEVAPATPDSQLPTMKRRHHSAKERSSARCNTWRRSRSKAREVDARTDIFAFGAVVYEMATGKKAFEGKSFRQRDGADSGSRAAVDVLAAADDASGARPRREEMPGEGTRQTLADGQRCMRGIKMDCRRRLAGWIAGRRLLRPQPPILAAYALMGACRCRSGRDDKRSRRLELETVWDTATVDRATSHGPAT